MFGYIVPDKPYMYIKDMSLYKAFYCGSCLCLKKDCGNLSRVTTNYDMTFLAVFFYSYFNIVPKYHEAKCLLHPIKKFLVVTPDELMHKLMAFNVILAYNNLKDNVVDGEWFSKVPARLLKKAYKKSLVGNEKVNQIIEFHYSKLRELEKQNCSSIDRVADCFACMMKDCAKELTQAKYSDDLGEFMYSLGRFIYIIDAIDDCVDDSKDKAYNPYIAKFGPADNRVEFYKAHMNDFQFDLRTSINSCKEYYQKMNLSLARNFLDNIILRGLDRKMIMILSADKKPKSEKI